MRKLSVLVLLVVLAPANARQGNATKPAPSGNGPASGHWIITADYLGTPVNLSLELNQVSEKLTGILEGDKLEGSLQGTAIHFLAKDNRGGSEEVTATDDRDRIQQSFPSARSSVHRHSSRQAKLGYTATPRIRPAGISNYRGFPTGGVPAWFVAK